MAFASRSPSSLKDGGPAGPPNSSRRRAVRSLRASARAQLMALIRAERRDPDREGPARHLSDSNRQDRKSTRLNSSHVKISYAVVCLKKKNRPENRTSERAVT